MYVYMAVDQNPDCRGPPPLLQTFVAGSLLQTLVADLCVEYCSLQGACRGGVCRRTPPSVTNLCCEMAAQACCKANVFDSLPYVYIYIYTYIHISQPVSTNNILRFIPEVCDAMLTKERGARRLVIIEHPTVPRVLLK